MEKVAGIRKYPLFRYRSGKGERVEDLLVVEEPMEIKLGFGAGAERRRESLSITMRTPGHDFELALGFLYTEGLIASRKDVLNVRYAGEQLAEESQENIVLVDLHPSVPVDWDSLSRHFYTSSSCGVCGKASIEMVQQVSYHLLPPEKPALPLDVLRELGNNLLDLQSVFRQTGGIHAAAIFEPDGTLQCLREDVGRHNALDKVIGSCFQKDKLPLKTRLLWVSGRASFELVQKALMAGIPILCSVGAPSSLAVALAEEYGMTLIGFLRDGNFNVYCGIERIQGLGI